jgi:hypothetical protein
VTVTPGVVLAFGLLLGMQHATEADHLAAVAALAGRARSLKAGMVHGIAWGTGHALVLLLVAGALAGLGWVLSPLIAGNMERVVGAMLIVLGIGVVRRLRHAPVRSKPEPLPWRSVAVGMVHGLAGSAALALLVSQSMPTPAGMLAYVGVFGVGSIVGMALLSGALAIPLGLTARHLTRPHRILNVGTAVFSIGLGARLLLAPGA